MKSLIFSLLLSCACLLGASQLSFAQDGGGVAVDVYTGVSNILTSNCSGPGGLCQAAPACNNGAGPNPLAAPGQSGIQATVTIIETVGHGTTGVGTLTATGAGTGFQTDNCHTYYSLIYWNPNKGTCSRFPQGVAPTLQNLAQADSDFTSMMLGIWNVNPDGSATLKVTKEATFDGLQNYYTVSVRELQTANTLCYVPTNDPAPQFNALRACGPLAVTKKTIWLTE